MAETDSLTSSHSSFPLNISVFTTQSSLNQSFEEQSTPVVFSNINAEVQEQSIVPYVVAAVVVFFVWLVGSCANGVMIVTFVTRRVLLVQQPVFLLLLNLSCADFLLCFFGTPAMFISAVNRGWAFGQTVCNLYAFGMSTAGITNACTVAAIAVERYRIVKRSVKTPLRNRQILGLQLSISSRGSSSTIQGSTYRTGSKGNTGLMLPPPAMMVTVACIWLYAIGVSVQPYLGWSDFVVEGIGFSCAPRWDTVVGGWRVLSYSIFLIITAFCLPCAAVVVCYTLLVRHVESSSMSGQQHFEDRISRLKKLTALMIAAFLSTWLPYALFSLFVMSGYEEYIPLWLGSMPVVWCKFSVMVNPFVYYFTVAKLRTAIRKTLSSFWRRCRKAHSRASSSKGSRKPSKSQPNKRQTLTEDTTRSPLETPANSSRRTSAYPTAIETALTCGSVEHPSVKLNEKENKQEDVPEIYCGSDAEELKSSKIRLASLVVSPAIIVTKRNPQSSARSVVAEPIKSPQKIPQTNTSVCAFIERVPRGTSALARQTTIATAVPFATTERIVAMSIRQQFHEENENIACRYCTDKRLSRNNSVTGKEQEHYAVYHAKSSDSAVHSSEELQPASDSTTSVPHKYFAVQQTHNRNRNCRKRAKSEEKRKSYAQIARERNQRGYSKDKNGIQANLNTNLLLSSQFVILRLLDKDEAMDADEVKGALVTSASLSKHNFLPPAAARLGRSIAMLAAENVVVRAAPMALGEDNSDSLSQSSEEKPQSDSGNNGISVFATTPCSKMSTGNETLHYTWV